MFDFGPETRACYRESALELHDSVKLPVDTVPEPSDGSGWLKEIIK